MIKLLLKETKYKGEFQSATERWKLYQIILQAGVWWEERGGVMTIHCVESKVELNIESKKKIKKK